MLKGKYSDGRQWLYSLALRSIVYFITWSSCENYALVILNGRVYERHYSDLLTLKEYYLKKSPLLKVGGGNL